MNNTTKQLVKDVCTSLQLRSTDRVIAQWILAIEGLPNAIKYMMACSKNV